MGGGHVRGGRTIAADGIARPSLLPVVPEMRRGSSMLQKKMRRVRMHVGPLTKIRLTASSGFSPNCIAIAEVTVHPAVASTEPMQIIMPPTGSWPKVPQAARTQPTTRTSIEP